MKEERRLVLFAPGFSGLSSGEIRGKVIGVEGFDVEFNQADEGGSEIGELSAASVYEGGDGNNFTAARAHDVEGFLNTAASGDDVFDDEETVSWMDFEAASEDETAFFFFCKDVGQSEAASHFVAYNEASKGWRDDACGAESGCFFSELRTKI